METTGHLSMTEFGVRADRMDALLNDRKISVEEWEAMCDLLDGADAYGYADNVRVVDELLAGYEEDAQMWADRLSVRG